MNHKGSWIIIIIGIIIMASGVPSALQKLAYVSKTKIVSGTIVRTAETDFRNSHYYIPIVDFTALDGQTQEFKSKTMDSPAKYKIGDKVDVIYDPANPTDAEINYPLNIWSEPGSTAIIGLLFIFIGIFAKPKNQTVIR